MAQGVLLASNRDVPSHDSNHGQKLAKLKPLLGSPSEYHLEDGMYTYANRDTHV